MFDYLGNQSAIDARRQDLANSVNQQYQDMMDQLAKSENLYRSQFTQQKGLSEAELARAREIAGQQAQSQTYQQQRNYADLITQARQRARAAGGVVGSGVESMYGNVDQNLQQNLYNIGLQRANQINSAQLQTNKTLMDLQTELDKQIALIEADRTKSLREKNDKINEITYQALAQADKLKRAAAASGSGGYGYYGANTGAVQGVNVGPTIDTQDLQSPNQDLLAQIGATSYEKLLLDRELAKTGRGTGSVGTAGYSGGFSSGGVGSGRGGGFN